MTRFSVLAVCALRSFFLFFAFVSGAFFYTTRLCQDLTHVRTLFCYQPENWFCRDGDHSVVHCVPLCRAVFPLLLLCKNIDNHPIEATLFKPLSPCPPQLPGVGEAERGVRPQEDGGAPGSDQGENTRGGCLVGVVFQLRLTLLHVLRFLFVFLSRGQVSPCFFLEVVRCSAHAGAQHGSCGYLWWGHLSPVTFSAQPRRHTCRSLLSAWSIPTQPTNSTPSPLCYPDCRMGSFMHADEK